MKTRFLLLLLSILILLQYPAMGQADVSSSTHWYNRSHFNPASIARDGFVYVFSNVRRQWTGIEGAPTVYTLQASGFSDEHQSAYGFSVSRDEIGLTTASNPTFQYAHRVGLTPQLDLSLGMAAGVYTRRVNASLYDPVIADDPALDYSDKRFTSPDAHVGVELQAKHFLAGFSSTHIFALWKQDDDFLISNHRYFYALYRNSDSEVYNITAGIQLANRRNLTYVEASSIVRFKRPTGLLKGPTELFDIGFTYRSVPELTLITGIHLTPNMRLGYTYDFNFSSNINSNGTHEIILEYRIPLHVSKHTGLPWYD
ncbi:PorP/SprF family type IX secretion system membrane protein [Maribellus sp. YY47]|uniref:PorP/SprF family type IX secretion system membrane protein n=1 Tax=Maribellus sp. YY47 TaxID=2929486 RepID=UPI00200161C5|nr:PorP/SprF family type IX secretion system membrane protein [Maribellus sp. YY47]MCK3684841.1 PorP/SprF family type IX secretion system membrane protein [Maribellus sp. YY47]